MRAGIRSSVRLLLLGIAISISTHATVEAGDAPYIVRGNQHLLVGIVLDEAAVRSALPKGLEPAEGITGGINIYTSKGGEGVAAYSRFYVWVDLKGHESVNGVKARYILWAATSTGPDKLKKAGNLEVNGNATLEKSGPDVTGSGMVGGNKVMSAAIKLKEDQKCGPMAGSVNYPSLPDPAGKMVITQYSYAGTACGASPVAAEFMVDADHALAKFTPKKMIWAAFVPDLSFSGSPLIPVKMAEQ